MPIESAPRYFVAVKNFGPSCPLGSVVEVLAHDWRVDTVRVSKDGIVDEWSRTKLMVYFEPLRFPLPADKDPWAKSEPAEPAIGSWCDEVIPELSRPLGYGAYRCNRASGHAGHHISRQTAPEKGKVIARWPRAAPSAEEHGPKVGDPYVITDGEHIGKRGRVTSVSRGEVTVALDEAVAQNPAPRPGPVVGMEVVRTDVNPAMWSSVPAGARGVILSIDRLAEEIIARFPCVVPHIAIRATEWGVYFVPAAEWGARPKWKAANINITGGFSPDRPPEKGRFVLELRRRFGAAEFEATVKNADAEIARAIIGQTVSGRPVERTVGRRGVYTINEDGDPLVSIARMARALFELDFDEHAGRVGDDGKGGIGKAAVLERMWDRVSEETRATYEWRAVIALKRAEELA